MKKLTILILVLTTSIVTGFSQAKTDNALIKEMSSFSWRTSDGLPFVSNFTGSYSVEVFKQVSNHEYAFLSKAKRSVIIFNTETGQKEKTLYLPFFPVDFAVAGNQFIVAGTQNLYTLDASGKIISKQFFGNKIQFV
ncbi:MAG: hypothetical protein J7L46_03795, partial [Bacteroidales bacterium]|nr:hypothetical protein [Bacteroidales bacterium]